MQSKLKADSPVLPPEILSALSQATITFFRAFYADGHLKFAKAQFYQILLRQLADCQEVMNYLSCESRSSEKFSLL